MKLGASLYKLVAEKLKGHKLRRYGVVRTLNQKIQTRMKSDYAVVQGSKMHLGVDDNYNLSIYGVYEPQETELVRREIKEGNNVVDIGASIGYYTLLFSRLVGPTGKVFAFESDPGRFRILKENIEINNYHNITAENKAVSYKNGEAKIFGVNATTIKLDSYLESTRIDFVKMDIEGHEKLALDGMVELLQRNHHIKMMLEYHPQILSDYSTKAEDLLSTIEKQDFKIYDIIQGKMVTKEELLETYPNADNASTNLFCFRE